MTNYLATNFPDVSIFLVNDVGGVMGAWGVGIFQNDTALDWVGRLVDQDGAVQIHAALDDVLGIGADYLDADLSDIALAAIEVIALLCGEGNDGSYPNVLRQWSIENSASFEPAMLEKSLLVIDRILTKPSENLEVFEGEALVQWIGIVLALRSRMEGIASKLRPVTQLNTISGICSAGTEPNER